MIPSLIEYMVGKGDAIRVCIRCGYRFQADDRWLKIWSRDGALAVALCDSCAAQAAARTITMPEREPEAVGARE